MIDVAVGNLSCLKKKALWIKNKFIFWNVVNKGLQDRVSYFRLLIKHLVASNTHVLLITLGQLLMFFELLHISTTIIVESFDSILVDF